MDQSMRNDQLAKERLTENEKLTHANGKLCMKIALMMTELERSFLKQYGDVQKIEDDRDGGPKRSSKKNRRSEKKDK